jgi:hypothetical protein
VGVQEISRARLVQCPPMAGDAVRLLAITLLLALVACGGCAERRGGGSGASPAPATVPTPAPEPQPTPTPVPASLACSADADCTSSPFARPVAGPGDCYCLVCPEALAAAAAGEHEASWQRYCGPAFDERARCLAPMCARPRPPSCVQGACTAPLGG